MQVWYCDNINGKVCVWVHVWRGASGPDVCLHRSRRHSDREKKLAVSRSRWLRQCGEWHHYISCFEESHQALAHCHSQTLALFLSFSIVGTHLQSPFYCFIISFKSTKATKITEKWKNPTTIHSCFFFCKLTKWPIDLAHITNVLFENYA